MNRALLLHFMLLALSTLLVDTRRLENQIVDDDNEDVSSADTNLSRKLPQAIIIGAKKCGTRALLKFIGAHPNVTTAGAEVHFFDRFYHMGFDWYRKQMPLSNDHQITMEKTPKYLIDPLVPERVHKMNPKTKLIIVLRDPVTRAISEYVQGQWRRRKRELDIQNVPNDSTEYTPSSERFKQMVYKVNGSKSVIRADWTIVRNGIYINPIKQWLKYFPKEQILFVNGERLIKEPHEEINRLQAFLNLKAIIRKQHFVKDEKKGFSCIVKPLDSNQVKCLNDQKGRKHPNIEPSVLKDLADFYRPYNLELFSLLGAQDPWWPL